MSKRKPKYDVRKLLEIAQVTKQVALGRSDHECYSETPATMIAYCKKVIWLCRQVIKLKKQVKALQQRNDNRIERKQSGSR